MKESAFDQRVKPVKSEGAPRALLRFVFVCRPELPVIPRQMQSLRTHRTFFWSSQSINVIAKTLVVLIFILCLVNIGYLGGHIVKEKHSTPFSLIPPQDQRLTTIHVVKEHPLFPVVRVDDEFSAEDASYSVSDSEEDDDEEEEENVVEEEDIKQVIRSGDGPGDDEREQMEKLDLTPDDAASKESSDREVTDNDDDDEKKQKPATDLLSIIDLLAANHTLTHGKHQVLSLLYEAGVKGLDTETIRQLPYWSQISNLFYSSNRRPVIHGLESCETYRQTVPLEDRYLGVAGLFNSGTNALSFLLRQNIIMPQKAQWQVPWGKHRLERIRHNHTAPNMDHLDKKHVLPIVIVKEPFSWLQSMCKSPYETRWKHSAGHCPNLVPNQFELKRFPVLQGHKTVPVRVFFSENQTIYWDSLVSFYNEWYRLYYDVQYPRLIVRFEDLLFAPEELLQAIADCAGADLASTIAYKTESSKEHGSQTNLVGAMIKTGTGAGRFNNMTKDDLDYVEQFIDKELMTTFDYMPSVSAAKLTLSPEGAALTV